MKQLVVSILIFCSLSAYSDTWRNPMRLSNEWVQYGIGDPYVMKYNGLFYLYCSTRDDQSGVKVWSSKDLVNWKYEGLCATDPKTKGAYAPEVIQWGGYFYMYTSPAGHGHYVLKSNSPTGPFEIVTNNLGMSIDGSVFKDDDGSLYFYHSGHNGIVGRQMSSPVNFGPEVHLASTSMRGWTEGPSLIKRRGIYYMSYTGNHVISHGYRVDFATSRSGPLSGFIADMQNPVIVSSEGNHVGLGHGTLFRGPNLDEYFTTYHNLVSVHQTGPFRNLNIDRVTFSGDRMLVYGPTNTYQQAPLLPHFADYFDQYHQSTSWTYSFSNEWVVDNGKMLFQRDMSNGDGLRFALINELPESNYIAEFNVAESSPDDELHAGVIFNYVNDDNYGLALLNKNENKLVVRFIAGGITGLELEALLPGVDNYSIFRAIRIEKQNEAFRFYVDDMLKITANQSINVGQFGLISLASNAKFGFSAFSNQSNGSSAFEVAKPIPGKFAATHYMKGGNGIGYNSINETINTYRYDQVALVNSPLGGLAVKAVAGEWYKYSIMVASSGLYNMAVGGKPSENGVLINIYQDSEIVAENVFLAPIDGSYRAFALNPVYLNEGISQLRIEVLEGEVELTEFILSSHSPVTGIVDTFDRRYLYAAWNYTDGTWRIQDSAAYAQGYGKRLLGNSGWSDYSVVVDIKYIAGMNGGLMFRATNPAQGGPNNSPQLGADFFQGYFVTLEPNRVVLGKHNYNYLFLAQKPGSYTTNQWYRLAVTVKGNNIKIYVNDLETPVIDYTDNMPFINGKAGLRVFNSTVLFDNFIVTTDSLTSIPINKPINSSEQNEKASSFLIYPNPTNGKVRLVGPTNNATVTVVDAKGEVVKRTPFCANSLIDLSPFGKGMYWLIITQDNQTLKQAAVLLN